jgi:glycosyltransferase involved in cell wall biosynthesis
MKITLISQYFYPEQFSNNEIARHLHDVQGHDVQIITGVPNYPAGSFFPGYSNQERRQENWEGIDIYRCWTAPRGTGALRLLLNYLTFPVAGIWTALSKSQKDGDVSLVSMPSPLLQALVGIFLKWRYQTPLVYWVQDIWPESVTYTLEIKNPVLLKLLTWMCGWIYRRADLILVQSKAFPPMIERFGIPADKIRVFPNTAPTEFKPLNADPKDHIGSMMPAEGFRILFAGNIGESQDFGTYIAAARILKDSGRLVRWAIVGSGRDMNRVEQEVSDHGLNEEFLFLGRFPKEEMPLFFSHADAMLVGLKDNPIFRLTVPYKIQCYMACWRPIIASLNGEGARVIKQSGAGRVAHAASPKALAEAIEEIMDMPATERGKLGQNALAYYQANYAADKIYGDLEQWLKEASGH